LKETLVRLDATGIRVADLEVVALRPETDIAGFTAFFEAGARLGASNILVAGYDPDLGRFSDRFAAFCEAAAPYGLTADLEFMPWTNVPDLATARRAKAASTSSRWRAPCRPISLLASKSRPSNWQRLSAQRTGRSARSTRPGA
jgi:hypothetical protein